MGCIALVRCVLVLGCGLAVVVWYLYAGEIFGAIKTVRSTLEKTGTRVIEVSLYMLLL